MATVALPPDLRNRIAAVAHRVRRLRVLRGLALLTLILAVGFGAALLADYFLDLPSAVRIGVLAAWAGLGLAVALFGLLLPLTRRLDAADIAAAVEEQYPDLGERLTTSVELADAADEYHGAPELIAGVVRDTDARTRRLNFLRAVSGKTARRLGIAAAALLLLVLCPAAVRPGQYADLTQRFFRPWVTPPAFEISAAPVQPFAARGRPLTLTAHLTPRRHVAAPDACTLVQIASNGKETRSAMPADKHGGYSATITPVADFRYRVEAGPDASATYPIETVQLVELGANSPEITAKPPPYAEDTVDAAIEDGLVDVSVLQNGTLRFDCTFTRPAVAAYLDWTPTTAAAKPNELANNNDVHIVNCDAVTKSNEGVVSDPAAVAAAVRAARGTVSHELTLGPDRQTGTITLPAVASGKYQLRLVAEHGLENTSPEHAVVVTPDLPPQFTKTPAKQELKAVLPYDRVPLEFAVGDDVAVAGAEVEYRVNKQEPARDPIALTGQKTREATSKDAFALSGKVHPGDTVDYRIRVSDNLPPEFGGPHVIFFPADRWLSLRVATDKEIVALRDDINNRLEKIKEDLKAEIRGVYKTRSESRDRPALTPSQAKDVNRLKNDNSDTEKNLDDLAKAADEAPSYKPLADLAREVAAAEMKQSERSLDSASADRKTPAEREAHFQDSEKQLDSALAKLEQMKRQNEELAQKALAQEELAKLADKEQSLAEKAADLASKDPVKDPSARDEADKIKQQQQQNADELRKLTDQNPELQKALQEANAQQARDLAQRAQELAQQQQELAKASADTEKRQNEERLADLARRQQELADKANELAKETKDPAQAAKTNPLRPEDAQKAADALKQGDAQEALKHQDQEAHDLDRLADELAKAIDLAKDPREAARQLARLEDALKQRTQDEIQKKDADKPLADRLKPLNQEQKAIHDAAERLSVPPANQDAQREKQQAAEQAAKAADALKQNNPWWAADLMNQTKQSLDRLADRLPTLEQRKVEAQKQVAEIRKKQDEVAQKVQQAADQARNADAKDPRTKDQIAQLMNEAARKQADAAEQLAKLDAPNQEARQERAEDALNQAMRDLMDGRKEDLAASQADAKRQLERLEQALKGEKPADEKAAELAKKQQALADEAAKEANDPKTTPEQKDALKQAERQVAQEAKNLDASEAPQRKAEAADSAEKAAKAAEANPTTREAQKQMQEAAKKLDDLAKQMQGRESDAARAQRLADRQAEAAAEAQRQAKQQPNAPPSEPTRQKEQQVADEAKQLHAGAEAQGEKQRATEALQKAQDAAPQDQAKAQREAADALRDLADKMAGRDTDAAKANELAKEQRDLAKQAANPQAAKDNPDELRKAAEKQAEIARQTDRLDPKNAAEARKDAAQKESDAAKALDQAQKPSDAADQLAKAADAADKLAQELGRQQAAKPPDQQPNQQTGKPTDSPRQAAEQLAQKQRQLAQQTQQAQNLQNQKPAEAGKQAMQDALAKEAQKQQELGEDASRLSAGQQQKALEQAREAMNQAQQALERNQPDQAKQKQNEAADALQRLAQQLPDKPDAAQRAQAGDAEPPQGLPNKGQADEARDLAKQQRDLEDAVRRAAEEARRQDAAPRDNPLGDLAKQQQEVAQQADQLAQQANRQQGKDSQPAQEAAQAHQSAQQAANQMQAGEMQQAQRSGQQAAQQMRQLQKQLAQTPGDAKAPAEAQQAQQLAEKQEEINRKLDPLAQNPVAERAQQQAQQQALQQQTGELTQDLNKLAQQLNQARQGQQANQAQQAANSSQQAQNAQQQAQQQAQQGDQGGEHQSQQQAAQSLQQAAQQMAQAGREPGQQPGQQTAQQGQQQTGQSLQQAQNAMQQAQGKMQQGQPQGAQQAMSQAAQSLAQAAQQAAQQGGGQKGDPGEPGNSRFSDKGVQPGGTPDASLFTPELKQYAGKTWGELPGELRTKIVQQAKVKYGDDYARMIKLYFEQAADTRNRK
jgi:hypothetical protein